MASGDTKTEALMNILENGGSIEGISGSGNTKFQDYIVDNILSIDSAKDAIASKGGTVGDTGLAGLADEIASIPSGGGSDTSDEVRFIDYDGTIIKQMSAQEATALTELPAGPTHDGLTFDGWTHTLAQVKEGHMIDVGALYVSSNNADETVFEVQPTAGQEVSFNFAQDTANGVSVDWGDGSTPDTYADVGTSITASHTYSTTPKTSLYIRVLPSSGANITTISSPSGMCISTVIGRAPIFGASGSLKVVVTKKCTSTTFTMGSTSAKCVVIPNTFTSLGTNAFSSARSLTTVVLPETITTISSRAINQCYLLERLVLPKSIYSIAVGSSGSIAQTYGIKTMYYGCELQPPADPSRGSFLYQCYGLSKFIIDKKLDGLILPSSFFLYTYSLHSITIPEGVIELSAVFLGQTNFMHEIIFEDRTTMPTMHTDTFKYHLNPLVLDFTKCKQVPTFDSGWSGANATGIIIKVPASLEASWKAANGWNEYAANIVGV